jgi:hypothetical protein
LFFKNRHISSALAELIRSTRAPTKDRLIGKIMGGNPAFRSTRVPVHMLAELVPPRIMGKLAFAGGRVGAQLCDHHDDTKRAVRRTPRPDAGDPKP